MEPRFNERGNLDAYADVAQVWQLKIQKHSTLYTKYIGQTVIEKYTLPVKSGSSELLGDEIDADLAIQLIWTAADEHIKKADALK